MKKRNVGRKGNTTSQLDLWIKWLELATAFVMLIIAIRSLFP